MKRICSLIIFGLLTVGLSAQDGRLWTLQDCIAHALENNISLKQQEIQVKQQEIQLNTSRNSRLPGVSASASENFSFGRGLTADNTYSNTNTTSTGVSLGASVPVFQGHRINNSIKHDELNLKAVTADFQKAREDVSVAVMELSGKASKVQVAQQKAALGQSRLSETQAANSLRLSLLDLSQLLELPNPEGFSIVRPSVSVDGLLLSNPEDIYAQAVACKPSIQAEQFRLDATEYSIRNAKGARLPSLMASGGLGTNYYTMSSHSSDPFADQIKNNFSQYLGLSLSIPIFSGFQTRNQIRSAELSRTNQMLQLENSKKSLYKEIQQAYYNAVAAHEKFRSSLDADASAKESYELVLAKYENGKANITEFNEARDSFLESESNLARARYEFLFSAKLLDFYRGQKLIF